MVQNVNADGIVLNIENYETNVWNVDAEGDTWQAGTLSVAGNTQSYSTSTGSIVTAGGVGIGGDLYVERVNAVEVRADDDVVAERNLSVGSDAVSDGSYVIRVADQISNLATSTQAVVILSLLGGSNDFNALLVSVVIRRTDDETRNQRDLFWVTSQGTHGTVTNISSDTGTGGTVSYTLSFSGNDLVLTHSESGYLVSAAISVQGLTGVAP